MLAQRIDKNSAILAGIVRWLRYTPPFGAAAAMIHPDLVGLYGLGIIVMWILGLAALLVWLEKRPPQRQATASVKIEWDSPFDRVGALFGPRMGPLVGHWLRFYGRNSRTRTLCLISIPLLAFLTFQIGQKMGPYSLLISALGTVPMATFLGTSRISVNQFGYVGGAFRRYFLLPTDPAATLRAASYAAVVIGGSLLPVALLAWAIFVPYRFDPRMLVMLLCTGLTGLFVLNALGIWVTLFNPRKGNYNSNFGNDLSLGGNIVLIGGMMVAMFLPRLLHHFQPALVSPESWWMYLPLPAARPRILHGDPEIRRPHLCHPPGAVARRRGRKKLAMDAIRTTNLVKKYGQKLAVENLSLAVRAGTMFGFLGPNGSGKSTTIGCMTGLLDPTSGEIELLGQRFDANNAAIKRRIGVMPETLGLFEPLYAHEFLAFVARMFGLDEATTRKRVTELLEALELTDTSKTLSRILHRHAQARGLRRRSHPFAGSAVP